jgi:tRNA(Ile)-lysidine synthase
MQNTIKENGLIAFGDRIIIGLSGGPDSLAMTHALLKLRKTYGLELYAVHVNHMFRGEQADDDEAFVIAYCKENDVPCYTFRVDVMSKAKTLGLSFEEAGREVRYEKFDEVMKQVAANKIAVAQNKNDVIETFFINLFRGAGIDGLASIDYMRDNRLIRPILDVSRDEVERYCVQNNLKPRHDHTNDENDYMRNKIRNAFLPHIREHFNPSVDETIGKTIRIMKSEKAFWQAHQNRLFDVTCKWVDDEIHIDHAAFDKLLEAEKHQLLRYCILKLRGNLKDVSYETISRMAELNRTGALCEIDKDFSIVKQYDALVLYANNRKNAVQSHDLIVKRINRHELANYKLNQTCVAIDHDTVKGVLHVRTRREGDRFVPLGMKGHKKIKDFFIDEKVPKFERDTIQLVCDEEKIIWIENMRLDDRCKITETTNNIMILSFQELVERE